MRERLARIVTEITALRKLNRRTFLEYCGMSLLPGTLAACGTAQSAPFPTASATTSPVKPTPTQSSIPTSEDWSTLASNLNGSLVRPNSPQYQSSYHLYNTRFDMIRPTAVAYCTSFIDVQTCLSFVSRFALPLAVRAGGHSYAGYSTTSGFVLDVTRMNTITVDANAGTATIGAGARLIDVYAALAQSGHVLPAGSCGTVGVAGLTLGGGAGVLSRKFGLTCDSLLSAQVVLADNRLLTCDASQHADLFWALRGGGGGNFGVVTSFKFRIYPATTLSLFTLRWPWSAAVEVVDAWQRWGPQAPDELWSNCLLLGNPQGDPSLQVSGVYVGPVAPLNTLLQQLINKIPTATSSRYVGSTDVLNTMLDEAGCYAKTVSECHLPGQTPDGQLQRDSETYKSDYFTQLLSHEGVVALVNTLNNRETFARSEVGGIGLDAYGGAIKRITPNATAFVHRSALFSAQYSAIGDTGWLRDTWQIMRPYASGEAYQNYIDPDLPNWLQAYYGANLLRLQQVKASYDPHNFFHFKQSIPVPSGT
jgi:FAD/FMN-containing dehydrogenase